jgi:tripartite-type tricarboxylate transporter receptor subunit TctC
VEPLVSARGLAALGCGVFAAALGAALAPAPVAAQEAYPSRPIRFVVPWPPGGPADVTVRELSASLTKQAGYQFVIDNRGGANGNIGADAISHSAPDGYTIGLVASSHAANMSLYKGLQYDLAKDFVPVASMLTTPFYLVVHPALPANSLVELLALVRAKPGKITYGSAGPGGGAHIAAELFKSMAGVDLLHVPYKGTAPALVDVVGGRIDLMFASAAGTLNLVKDGRLRVLGMTGATRSPQHPEIPTLAEAGVPGYGFAGWFGVVAPAGTPKPMAARLNAAINAAMKTPLMAERLAADGSDLLLMSPEQFGDFIPRQVTEWGKLLRTASVKGE